MGAVYGDSKTLNKITNIENESTAVKNDRLQPHDISSLCTRRKELILNVWLRLGFFMRVCVCACVV